jgi:hypothetical protein
MVATVMLKIRPTHVSYLQTHEAYGVESRSLRRSLSSKSSDNVGTKWTAAAESYLLPAAIKKPTEVPSPAGHSSHAGKSNGSPRGDLVRRAAAEHGPDSGGLITKALQVVDTNRKNGDS